MHLPSWYVLFIFFLSFSLFSVTNGGKTTLAKNLQKRLPNCSVISQDDFFKVSNTSQVIHLIQQNPVSMLIKLPPKSLCSNDTAFVGRWAPCSNDTGPPGGIT